jgi:hypothetical protein
LEGAGAPNVKGEEARLSSVGLEGLAPNAKGTEDGGSCACVELLLPNPKGAPDEETADDGLTSDGAENRLGAWGPDPKANGVVVVPELFAGAPPKVNGELVDVEDGAAPKLKVGFAAVLTSRDGLSSILSDAGIASGVLACSGFPNVKGWLSDEAEVEVNVANAGFSFPRIEGGLAELPKEKGVLLPSNCPPKLNFVANVLCDDFLSSTLMLDSGPEAVVSGVVEKENAGLFVISGAKLAAPNDRFPPPVGNNCAVGLSTALLTSSFSFPFSSEDLTLNEKEVGPTGVTGVVATGNVGFLEDSLDVDAIAEAVCSLTSNEVGIAGVEAVSRVVGIVKRGNGSEVVGATEF